MGTKYSNLLADINATPRELLHAGVQSGKVRRYQGTVALVAADLDANDIIMLARVPSDLRISHIWLFNDDLDSNGTPTLASDVGLYDLDEAVVDADAYASAIATLQSANTAGVNVAFEARDINAMGQAVWKDAGKTEDPGGEFLIGLTLTTGAATAAAGDVSFVIEGTLD